MSDNIIMLEKNLKISDNMAYNSCDNVNNVVINNNVIIMCNNA